MSGPRIFDSSVRDSFGLPKRFYHGNLGVFPPVALFTVGSTARITVLQIVVVNYTAAASTYTLYEPGNGAPLFAAKAIAANDTHIHDVFIPLEGGEQMWGYTGTVDSIYVHIFGMERNTGS